MKSLKNLITETKAASDMMEDRTLDLPNIIVLKRKAIRAFPNGKKVALYYADKIDQYVTIPFDGKNTGKKDIAQFNEEKQPDGNIAVLMQIIETGQSQTIKFYDGTSMKVDSMTAQAIVNVYNSVNTMNKIKIEKMVNKDKSNFSKVAAFSHGAHSGL